jgi:hypothetical protein
MKFGSNYAWFNNQFTTLTYCVLAQIITSYKYFFTNDITDEMKCVTHCSPSLSLSSALFVALRCVAQ